MNNRNLISIIIPVYNVEKYLFRCIESVTNQTYTNLEIILVNDGSTDASNKICEYFSKKDSRVVYLQQNNRGLASARNLGIDRSSGDYICFLDSDDWVDSKMYENMLIVNKITGAPIVACRSTDIYVNQNHNNSTYDGSWEVYENEHAINLLLDQTKVRFEVWNKLFLRSSIGNHRFIDNQIYEDVYFERKIFIETKKVCFLNYSYHYYLKERKGNTNSYFDRRKLAVYDEFKKFREDLKRENFFSSIDKLNFYVLNFARSQYNVLRTSESSSVDIKEIKRIFDDYYDSTDFKKIEIPIKRKIGLALLRHFSGIYNIFYS